MEGEEGKKRMGWTWEDQIDELVKPQTKHERKWNQSTQFSTR